MENPTTVRKIRIFFIASKKPFWWTIFRNMLSKFQRVHIFVKSGKVRNTAQSTKMADGIYPKLYIFNTPVQKEGNLPGFHIHTVCNLLLGHSSELKVILNQIRFVYFSAVWKIQLSQFNLHVKFQLILKGHNSSRTRISQQTKGFKTRAMLWVYHI